MNSSLIKISGLTAISTLIKVISNFISSKVIAVYSGPAGLAMLGQLSNLVSILLPVSTGAITTGVVKYSSEFQSDSEKLQALISTATKIISILSVITSLALLIFAGFWTNIVFHDQQFKAIIYLMGASTIFYAFNNYFLSLINGMGEYKTFVIVNIISSTFSLILTIGLSISFHVKGTLVAYILTQSLVFIFTLYYTRRSMWVKFISVKKNVDLVQVKNLFQYSLMALTTAAVVPTSQIYLRNAVISKLGIEQAGMWEAINRISSMYLMLITSSIGVYVLPKLSSLKEKLLIKQEIIKTYKILLPGSLFVTLLIFISKSWLVPFVLSTKFNSINSVLYIQLIGDFFKIGGWILGYNIIAQAMVKLFIVFEILFACLYLILGVFFLKYFNSIEGLLWAYLINYLLYWIVLSFLHYKKYE